MASVCAVVGCGPGMGGSAAVRFARAGYKIAGMCRTADSFLPTEDGGCKFHTVMQNCLRFCKTPIDGSQPQPRGDTFWKNGLCCCFVCCDASESALSFGAWFSVASCTDWCSVRRNWKLWVPAMGSMRWTPRTRALCKLRLAEPQKNSERPMITTCFRRERRSCTKGRKARGYVTNFLHRSLARTTLVRAFNSIQEDISYTGIAVTLCCALHIKPLQTESAFPLLCRWMYWSTIAVVVDLAFQFWTLILRPSKAHSMPHV